VARLRAAGRLNASEGRAEAEALRVGGHAREAAVLRLRAHLADVAQFELDRRRSTGVPVHRRDTARLVHDAAESALTAVLADLARYRGQSAFATWTAKYAIREAAAACSGTADRLKSRAEA
jgi:hypothetical protein